MARIGLKLTNSGSILGRAVFFAVSAAACFSIIFSILIFLSQWNDGNTIPQALFLGALNAVGYLLMAVLVGSPVALALATLTFGLLSIRAKIIEDNKRLLAMALSAAMGAILATLYQSALEWPDSDLAVAIFLSSPIAMAVLLKWHQPSEASQEAPPK